MYAELQAGFAAVKGALELAQAGKDAIDRATMANALYEVQSRLMDTQSAALKAMEENSQLAQRIRVLEAAASEVEDWKAEASKYVLTNVADGVSAYTEFARKEEELLRDSVKLCAHCFEGRKKSILQLQTGDMRRVSLVCLGCKSKLEFRAFADWQREQAGQR